MRIIVALLAVGVTGCANPGLPKPPSLRLPATVMDLAGDRVGNSVELRWTGPSRTTDRLDLIGPTTVEICRDPVGLLPTRAALAPESATLGSPAPTMACTTVFSTSGHAGPSKIAAQLPPELVVPGVHQVVAYRVRILNAAGRSASPSAPVFVACGPAPAEVAGFHATQRKAGVVLEWAGESSTAASTRGAEQVEVLRTLLEPQAQAAGGSAKRGSGAGKHSKRAGGRLADRPSEKGEVAVRLQAGLDVSGRGPSAGEGEQKGRSVQGMIDQGATDQKTYLYQAQRVLTLPGVGSTGPLKIRSEPTASIPIAMRDIFPPESPTGLVSVPVRPQTGTGQGGSIDLSWDAGSEANLAGCLIFRMDAMELGGPRWVQLTAKPVAGTAYQDATAIAGHHYRYRLVAVDRLGNESAPSAVIEDTVDGR